MRPFKGTISLDEARTIIDRSILPITRVARVSLDHANGRVLAETITSNADVPPFARAAMDGFAVRAQDTSGASRTTPRTLRRIEKVFTGQMPAQTVGAGQCIEIATGAPMPAGADAVVIVEETDSDDDLVRVFMPVNTAQNIGRQGSDIQKGQTVMQPGTLLNASRVGSLAALGLTDVSVFDKPRVAILSTGNEIVEPGQPLQPGQIYDINRFTLAAVVNENGGVAIPYRIAADTIEDLSRSVDECLEQDVLVFSGGSSVGERDLILDVVTAKGEMLFHGIAVKPGKPTAFGRIKDKLVFGMPGYPSSCLSNAHILLAPALRRIARLPEQIVRSLRLPLASRVTSVPGRHQFYSVRVENGRAVPAFKASGDITSMSKADGYIEIAAEVEAIDANELVDVKLF
ncbi:MAG TPA: gephyrin-like molybdotransferase Glp [Vicinamibacterales bacterium]